MSYQDWLKLKERLERSRFRSSIKLDYKDAEYYRRRGEDRVRLHARDFLRQRLAPARPDNDGKQTPWRGHPVFTAQHATATCCRKCLAKWHNIPPGRELTEDELNNIIDIIAFWLEDKVC